MLNIEQALEIARNVYGKYGVDVDAALKAAAETPVSIQCWQGDDVGGFEAVDGDLTGGIQSTGNYPGKARSIDELRADFAFAQSLIPGKKHLALHAIYLDAGGKKVARNEIGPEHFTSWIEWAKEQKLGLDYNPTFFSHPLSADGFTLSSDDESVRQFWVEHGKLSRKVSESFGKALGEPSVNNFWVPDGFKDMPVNRAKKRENLARSYEEIFAEPISKEYNLDAVESKLFGIGLESCTIGSNEFYMGCAMKHDVLLTLDTGHFHPTEIVSDKFSAALQYLNGIMLHVSRPVRWDSDHVVILDDELKTLACEINRGHYQDRVHIGLDFFDGSINRIACWAIGARSMEKAILWAALEPVEMLQKFEAEGDYTSRLAYLEELKTLPFGLVWNAYCVTQGVPAGDSWIPMMKKYEADVLSKR